MSVIAVQIKKKKVVIAADTQSCIEGLVGQHSKIFHSKENNLTVGYVGIAEEGVLLRLFCQEHLLVDNSEVEIVNYLLQFAEWMKQFRGEWSSAINTMVFVKDGKAFVIDGFMVDEVKTHMAVGSGAPYALAVMEHGGDAERAIEIACKFDLYCSLPSEVYTMGVNE